MATVTDYLERARECAELAAKLKGEDKTKLRAIADAWLELANAAAKEALKTGVMPAPKLRSKSE